MSNRFEIVVEGIEDASLVDAVASAIRDAFLESALPGSWRVAVRPSDASGRWDFTIHGLDVRHALSIAVPPHLLPSLIPLRLRDSLNNTVRRSAGGAVCQTLDLSRATSTPDTLHRGGPLTSA